jgi:hypothetical protein
VDATEPVKREAVRTPGELEDLPREGSLTCSAVEITLFGTMRGGLGGSLSQKAKSKNDLEQIKKTVSLTFKSCDLEWVDHTPTKRGSGFFDNLFGQ